MKPILTAALIVWAAYPVAASRTWRGFRGDGSSRSTARNVPVQWSETSNLAWQADLPGYGQSSPVIWESRVFVTSIDGEMQDRLVARCVDLTTGKLLWSRELAASQGVKASDYVSKAAPTPVVDDERVYLFFESGDLIALTHRGEPVWQRSLVKDYGAIKSNHGLGTSPVLSDGALFLQIQHENGSYLLCVDPKTGATRWKRDHPFGPGWATPIVTEHGGRACSWSPPAGGWTRSCRAPGSPSGPSRA